MAISKKKKIRRDLAAQLKKQKNDPNAPNATRMPMPDLRDSDKAEKAKAVPASPKGVQFDADNELKLLKEKFSTAAWCEGIPRPHARCYLCKGRSADTRSTTDGPHESGLRNEGIRRFFAKIHCFMKRNVFFFEK